MPGGIPTLSFPEHLRSASGFPDCLQQRRVGARPPERNATLDAAMSRLTQSAAASSTPPALLEDLREGLGLACEADVGCEFEGQYYFRQRLDALQGALGSLAQDDPLSVAQLRELRDEVLSLAAKSVERGRLGRLESTDVDDEPFFRLDQLRAPDDLVEAMNMLAGLRRTVEFYPASLPLDKASLQRLGDWLNDLRQADIRDLGALPRYRQLIERCLALPRS
ncbi:hypothetical protein [Roseateles chitinivorans]|uniref:hypothetical protein n=1 Tax=Roseateles chitinivorans TaxID=2917965 RepID=UPI003D67D9CC